jgi:hypothetical protein
VNVKFLIEAKRKSALRICPDCFRRKREQLRCDLVVVSDTPSGRVRRPASLARHARHTGLEVKVTGPNRDLHSGMYGGSVPNPIDVLLSHAGAPARPMGRVALPGFL